MPWNDAHGSPVYLDVRRFIPVGDIFDVGQGHAAIPWAPPLTPGGPLAMVFEVLLNTQQFSGKEITQDTDTLVQKAAKISEYLYKSFMPNILGLPGSYASTNVFNAMEGKTDSFGREQSVAQAVASSLGVKLASYPPDVLRKNLAAKASAQMREIDMNITKLARQRQTNSITEEKFRKAVEVEVEKKREIAQELQEKVSN